MSIRNIKDSSNKLCLCECYPNGRNGKRIRKKFATRGEATAFELFTIKKVDDKHWLGEKVDNRRLSELIKRWHELHGQQLTHPEQRQRKLDLICNGMDYPIASKSTVNDFANYQQMTHILRHTFASYFMMNSGNIILFNKEKKQILGHSDIKDTMRYGHFAPAHLDDAITKKPIANMDFSKK
ncbi:integrase [Shewanella sp. 1CM18E]|uniref:phage integrase n=1 Tax=Shewanella sp. 1CM18E TaxID=2929169 RepID=UPI0020BD50F2|nr:integrase [Shewanella sp. 1CM18E]